MNRFLIFIFLLPLSVSAQADKFPTKTDLAKTYGQALSDFIKAASTKNKTAFDTLFIGKRVNGQPDDFPDIALPKKIGGVQINLVTPEAGIKLQKTRKARIYINMVGWVEKAGADFIFVVFSNGFVHQYDYRLTYRYNVQLKKFELSDLQFKGPPFDK